MFGPSMSEVTADAIQAGRFEGIPLPPGSNNVAEDFKTYEVRDDDVWIVTYPKAGQYFKARPNYFIGPFRNHGFGCGFGFGRGFEKGHKACISTTTR